LAEVKAIHEDRFGDVIIMNILVVNAGSSSVKFTCIGYTDMNDTGYTSGRAAAQTIRLRGRKVIDWGERYVMKE
jgi:acetate kinase